MSISTLYVGTFTRSEPGVCEQGHGAGVYVFNLEPTTGKHWLRHNEGFDVGVSPSYITISHNHKWLISNNEDQFAKVGTIRISEINQLDASLSMIGCYETVGVGPSYVVTDRTDTHLLTTNYRTGSTLDYKIYSDGRLEQLHFYQYHGGSGVFPKRQLGPKAHAIFLDPDEKFAFVPDLGTDRIMQYTFDVDRGLLPNTYKSYAQAPLGCGPRHMDVHPNGKCAYLATELTNQLIVYEVDLNGCLHELQISSTLPEDYTGGNYVADIHVHPNGNFVYVSNRGQDSIAIFQLSDDGRKASLIGHQDSLGKTPRNFVIDEKGHLLLVGNQDSDNIVAFHIDQKTGLLNSAGESAYCPSPVCLKIVNF